MNIYTQFGICNKRNHLISNAFSLLGTKTKQSKSFHQAILKNWIALTMMKQDLSSFSLTSKAETLQYVTTQPIALKMTGPISMCTKCQRMVTASRLILLKLQDLMSMSTCTITERMDWMVKSPELGRGSVKPRDQPQMRRQMLVPNIYVYKLQFGYHSSLLKKDQIMKKHPPQNFTFFSMQLFSTEKKMPMKT